MNLKYKKVLKYVLISLVIIITCYFVFNFVRVKTAKVNIILKKDLTVEFASNIHVSDMIKNMNGTIKNDYKIDTTKLGTKFGFFRRLFLTLHRQMKNCKIWRETLL